MRKPKYSEEDKIFAQGYIAAMCNIIRANCGCDADTREAWNAGGYRYSELKKLGIGESDMAILKQYKKEVIKSSKTTPDEK